MTTKAWRPKDNSDPALKIALRKKYLPLEASVLDCFCGNGTMYHNVYEGRTARYHGLDDKKVHTLELCTLMDNEAYVRRRDLSGFNVFDLDAYGSPWKLFLLICRVLKKRDEPYVFFLTDGTILRAKLNSAPPRIISATESIPTSFSIPCINHWYVEMFMTMLAKAEEKYGLDIEEAVYLKNDRGSVYYWALRVRKR